MKLHLSIFVIILLMLKVDCEHLVKGNVANRVRVVHQEKVEYYPIPLKKRVKFYFYSNPNNTIIQGIQVLDNLHSKSSVKVTAGGLGSSFVNLRLKSERGRGMSYDIGIYVNEDY